MKEEIIKACLTIITETADLNAKFFNNMASAAADAMANIVATASGEMTVFTALAESFIICLFLMRLANNTLRDKQDPDALFKDIAWLLLFGTILTQLPQLVKAMSDIAQSIINAMANMPKLDDIRPYDASSELADLEAQMQEKNIFLLILDAALYCLGGNLGGIIIRTVASIAIWTVKIEIYIRTLFAPIGIAFLAESGGWNGPGGRYVKGWLACYLQIAIMAAAARAYSVIGTVAITGQGSPLVGLLAGGFAVAGICMKSSQLAREIMGS